MRHCRAKMIDGTPVTFDALDWDNTYPGRPNRWVTEYLGHGFGVISESPKHFDHPYRVERDRQALENAGVDIYTMEAKFDDEWVRVHSPPELKNEPALRAPSMLTYVNRPKAAEPTEGAKAMMDANLAERIAWSICKHLREGACLQCPAEVETDYGPGVQMCRSAADEVAFSAIAIMEEAPSLSQFPDLVDMSDMRLSEDASHPTIADSMPCVRIDKGIPIPPINRLGGRRGFSYLPFGRLQIGDSFVHPGGNAARAGAAASDATRRTKATFTVRTVVEDSKRVVRIWRIA